MEVERNEELEFLALSFLAAAQGPVGSTKLTEVFQQAGHDLALATSGRFLRQLELQGYTRSKGAKLGRIITDTGRERLEQLRASFSLQEKSARMLDAAAVNDLSDLHEVLLVRRAIESEAARLAAIRATDAELRAINEQARSHLQDTAMGRVPGAAASMTFHRSVVEASHNPILISVALILLEPRNPVITSTLQDVTVGADKVASHAADHGRLAAALLARDGERAEALMYEHIGNMIAPVAERLSVGGKLDSDILLHTEFAVGMQ